MARHKADESRFLIFAAIKMKKEQKKSKFSDSIRRVSVQSMNQRRAEEIRLRAHLIWSRAAIAVWSFAIFTSAIGERDRDQDPERSGKGVETRSAPNGLLRYLRSGEGWRASIYIQTEGARVCVSCNGNGMSAEYDGRGHVAGAERRGTVIKGTSMAHWGRRDSCHGDGPNSVAACNRKAALRCMSMFCVPYDVVQCVYWYEQTKRQRKQSRDLNII